MKTMAKKNFPLTKIRRFLEPGPIVLVSSAHKGERDIMTMGWHMMLGFSPALVGCYIWDQNRSYSLIRKSKECVINLPTYDLIDSIIGVGNTHGPEVDQFDKFGFTAKAASKVGAPLLAECYANFECKLADSRLVKQRGLFIFEVVKAHVAPKPRYPKTVHYRGEGVFMISGPSVNYRNRFKPENL
jgi:flavin reductase (DIM6/NTAB) family NADH-FMN oxidoreductase RutF